MPYKVAKAGARQHLAKQISRNSGGLPTIWARLPMKPLCLFDGSPLSMSITSSKCVRRWIRRQDQNVSIVYFEHEGARKLRSRWDSELTFGILRCRGTFQEHIRPCSQRQSLGAIRRWSMCYNGATRVASAEATCKGFESGTLTRKVRKQRTPECFGEHL